MFNKAINDGPASQNLNATNLVNRADLVVGGAASSVELPEKAVSEVAIAAPAIMENHSSEQEVKAFEFIRSSFRAIQQAKAQQEKLEVLRSKVMTSYKAIGEVEINFTEVGAELDQLEKQIDAADIAPLKGSDSPNKGHPKASMPQKGDSQSSEIVAQRKRVLDNISAVLEHIETIQKKLDTSESGGYDRLLDMNLFVTSLNIARKQADGNGFGLSAADKVVETIVSNVRSAVAAHGRPSSDLVRLVINA